MPPIPDGPAETADYQPSPSFVIGLLILAIISSFPVWMWVAIAL